MKSSVRKELEVYINECLEDGLKSHNEMFNKGLYLHGQKQCIYWLNHHDVDPKDILDAIVKFDKMELQYLATEHLSTFEEHANKLVFVYGLQLCAEADIPLCQ